MSIFGLILSSPLLAASVAAHDVPAGPIAPAPLLIATAVVADTPPKQGVPHELWRAADGLFYVDAVVNDHAVRFLVDTGASLIVLTAEDAQRIGVVPQPGTGYVADTAGGARAMAPVLLGEIEVAGRRANAVRAAVAPPGLGVSLLGQNWLAFLDTVTIEGDRMTLR